MYADPTGERTFLTRFNAAHDATVVQVALDLPGSVAGAWEKARETLQRTLDEILLVEEDLLNSTLGYTLIYQAAVGRHADMDEAFERLRPAARWLFSPEEMYPLADDHVAGGHIWLLSKPTHGDGARAATVYVALCTLDEEEGFVETFSGKHAPLLMPELIAHKSYCQGRQYQGKRYKEYKERLKEFRKRVRELLKELEQREIESEELSQLTQLYHGLADMVWQLEDLRVSMSRQLHNYDAEKITHDNDLLQSHRRYIQNANAELELLVSDGQYALGVADPVLSISRYKAEKKQDRRQSRTQNVLAAAAAFFAFSQVLDKTVTGALLGWLSGVWNRVPQSWSESTGAQFSVQITILTILAVVTVIILVVARRIGRRRRQSSMNDARSLNTTESGTLPETSPPDEGGSR